MNDELTLISRILSGDREAWSQFTESYSTLIQKTIARYVRDEEIARDLYATLFEKLKHGKLERFDSRSKLSTWLFIVARNHCRDYYRSTKGVRYLMTALEGLGPVEHRFFTLYYLQRLTLSQVFESMRLEMGNTFTYVDISDCMEAIKRTLSQKKLGRILDRLLHPDIRFIHETEYGREPSFERMESIDAPALSPEIVIESELLRNALENLRNAVLRLPHRDQLILQLRFEHKLSARKIGQILDMGNEKQVYRKLGRLYDELKSMLLQTDLNREEYGEVVKDMEYLCKLNALCEKPLYPGTNNIS